MSGKVFKGILENIIDKKKHKRFKKFKIKNYKKSLQYTIYRSLFHKIRRMCKEEFRANTKVESIIAPYIIDIYIPKFGIAIEIDGKSHDNKIEYDSKRDSFLENLGIQVLHFDNELLYNYTDAIVETVKLAVIERNNSKFNYKLTTNSNLNYFSKDGKGAEAFKLGQSRLRIYHKSSYRDTIHKDYKGHYEEI